ncbi:MAG TPA: signal recognition particle-docking protein FtsY [Acidimicrobiales bacterium]|nr:signal recognition particle-docking protein FtsY [Acidimicrobiales bacterium]
MIAIWIVLAVVVVALLTTSVLVGTRRRRRAGQLAPPDQAPPTVEAPPRPSVPPGREAPERAAAAPAAPPAAPPAEAPPAPPRLRDRLGKARGLFSGVVGSIRSRGAVGAATWDDLEVALLRADVGVATTDALLAGLRERVRSKEVAGGDQLVDALRADLVELLRVGGGATARTGGADRSGDGAAEPARPSGRALRFDEEPGVTNVWLFVGVNGVGKTTTVGKVARQQSLAGRSVLLAAGDTFRAAAGEQLETWADRSGVEIVRGAEGGDPSAIVFDAVQRAVARGNDLVLADTAGRFHTKVNLVEELKKIRRVADRDPGRVTEVLLVLDATTGQNALAQARQFTEAVAVTGLVLTKLDGSAKGGIVIAVQRELGIPVKLVGLGEGPDDLVPFDPEEFVDALLGG